MVAIKNMEIPKSCADCERGSICGYGLGYGRPDDCPLVEIVTCKDCKCECTWKNGEKFSETRPYFYCADGERRE